MPRIWAADCVTFRSRYHRACFAPGGSVVCGFAVISEYASMSPRAVIGSL